MPKANLDQTYLYKGKYYGPGEADFPEVEEAEKKGLSPGLKAALEGRAMPTDKVKADKIDKPEKK